MGFFWFENQDHTGCNMPKVTIKFDGKKKNWLSFRELFVSISSNSKLSEIKKNFNYYDNQCRFLHSFFNVNPTLKNVEWILPNFNKRKIG